MFLRLILLTSKSIKLSKLAMKLENYSSEKKEANCCSSRESVKNRETASQLRLLMLTTGLTKAELDPTVWYINFLMKSSVAIMTFKFAEVLTVIVFSLF